MLVDLAARDPWRRAATSPSGRARRPSPPSAARGSRRRRARATGRGRSAALAPRPAVNASEAARISASCPATRMRGSGKRGSWRVEITILKLGGAMRRSSASPSITRCRARSCRSSSTSTIGSPSSGSAPASAIGRSAGHDRERRCGERARARLGAAHPLRASETSTVLQKCAGASSCRSSETHASRVGASTALDPRGEQRRSARTGRAGDDRQAAARDGGVEPLEQPVAPHRAMAQRGQPRASPRARRAARRARSRASRDEPTRTGVDVTLLDMPEER